MEQFLAKGSAGNGQIRYGADVINRIIESGKPGGREKLQDAIIEETLNPLILQYVCQCEDPTGNQVYRALPSQATPR